MIQRWRGGLLAAALLLPAGASAQQPAPERQAMYEQYLDFGALVRGGVIDPQWLPNGRDFWYATVEDGERRLYRVDPRANRRVPLTAPPESPAAEGPAGSAPEPATLWAGPALRAPDGSGWLWVMDDDVWLRPADGGEDRRLTADGAPRHGWSTMGASWAPDASRFAIMKWDMRAVHEIPVVRPLEKRDVVEMHPYWLTGEALPQYELFVMDAATGRRTRVDAGAAPDLSFHVVGWRDGGRELLFTRRDRYSQWFDFLAADVGTGATRVLITERRETFVGGLSFGSMANAMYRPIRADAQFLWLSERTGWNHIYLYDRDGRLVRPLTSGDWEVRRIEAVDARRGWVYFTARAEPGRPYDTHLYRVRLDGGGLAKLTAAEGQHIIRFAPSLEYFIDMHAALDRPAAAELRAADGRRLQVLAQGSLEPLRELRWSPPEAFVVKAADGTTDLHGVLFKPWDFDPSRRYPVIDVMYHGPHSQFAPKTILDLGGCDYVYCAQALAQLGFITFTVDARGTPGRGKAFHDATWGQLGRIEIDDHVAALRQLARDRPYMDLRRVGISGYSFGGYYVLRAMLQAPDVYAVGVAGAPVVDFATATPGVIEPYLGPLATNRVAYEHASVLPLAPRLQGRLLLIHGTADVNVPLSQTWKIADALIRADKPFDMLILPEHEHVLTGHGRAYAREAVHRFFLAHLRP